MPMSISVLFTIARARKLLRCPSMDEWIKKLWYVHTIEYYLAIERNQFEPVEPRWMNLEPVIQSKISQKEKTKYHILTHMYGIQKNGTDESICRADIEKNVQTQQGKERVRQIDRASLTHIYYHVKNRQLVGSCCIPEGASISAL